MSHTQRLESEAGDSSPRLLLSPALSWELQRPLPVPSGPMGAMAGPGHRGKLLLGRKAVSQKQPDAGAEHPPQVLPGAAGRLTRVQCQYRHRKPSPCWLPYWRQNGIECALFGLSSTESVPEELRAGQPGLASAPSFGFSLFCRAFAPISTQDWNQGVTKLQRVPVNCLESLIQLQRKNECVLRGSPTPSTVAVLKVLGSKGNWWRLYGFVGWWLAEETILSYIISFAETQQPVSAMQLPDSYIFSKEVISRVSTGKKRRKFVLNELKIVSNRDFV